ncbi:MAG: hypothetical protein V3V01_04105 [Acidimicrobiales bacterium]
MAKSAARFIAVLGRTRRVGRWKVSNDNQVIAVLGKCHLDLTEAFVDDEAEEISMSVLTVFGSVSLLLPEGSQVRPSGIAILAADAIDLPMTEELTALAPLNLKWTALFARVRVTQECAEDAVVDEEQEPVVDGSEPVEPVELVAVPNPKPMVKPVESSAAETADSDEADTVDTNSPEEETDSVSAEEEADSVPEPDGESPEAAVSEASGRNDQDDVASDDSSSSPENTSDQPERRAADVPPAEAEAVAS